MKLILRPAIPPWSLTILLKNAISSSPLELYEDAGPLYGLVWPILISVAVTPMVSAAEPRRDVVASPATAAVPNRTALRRVNFGDDVMVRTPYPAAASRSCYCPCWVTSDARFGA